jgi:hypothetical protein
LLARYLLLNASARLQGGCREWWDLTALGHPEEWAPFPTPISWYWQFAPPVIVRLTTAFVLFSEVVVPLGLVCPIASFRESAAAWVAQYHVLLSLFVAQDWTLVCIPALLCLIVPSWVNNLWFPALIRTKWGGPEASRDGEAVVQLVMNYGAFFGLFAAFAAFAALSEPGTLRNTVSRETVQSGLTVIVFACWLASTVRISAQRAPGGAWLVAALGWTFLTGVCSLQVQASAKGTWGAVKSLPVDPDGLPVYRPEPYVCAVKKSGSVTGRPVFVLHVADRTGAWRPVELSSSPSDRIARAPWVPFHLPRTSYYTFLAARRQRASGRNGARLRQ